MDVWYIILCWCLIHPWDHSYPSFAKPIDTSHRVVCHGTLSTAESSCEEYKQHKQGGIYYPWGAEHPVQPVQLPDGQAAQEKQLHRHQEHLHRGQGGQKQFAGIPHSTYDIATMSCSHFWQVNHCSCFSSALTFFLPLYLQKFDWPHSVHDGDGCLLGVPAGWDGHGSWYMDMERDGDKF